MAAAAAVIHTAPQNNHRSIVHNGQQAIEGSFEHIRTFEPLHPIVRAIVRYFHTWDRKSVCMIDLYNLSVWSICMIYSCVMIHIFQGRSIPDLYDLSHVAWWEPYNLHDLSTVARVSWVGSLVHRSCTTPAQPLTNGRLGSRLSRSWFVRRAEALDTTP